MSHSPANMGRTQIGRETECDEPHGVVHHIFGFFVHSPAEQAHSKERYLDHFCTAWLGAETTFSLLYTLLPYLEQSAVSVGAELKITKKTASRI